MALIYCVEDDNGIRELITCALQSGGYTVEGFPNGRDFSPAAKGAALSGAAGHHAARSGRNAILKRLKAEEDTAVLPVIMLSAKSTEIDKVTSLENGADDYITKPFGIMELLSRVKAVLRRSGGKTAQKQGQLSCQGLLLDLDRRTASYESTEIVLTYKEFELLAYLMRNRGTAVSRDRLLEEVWGFQYEGETRTVDAHIKTLRQKLMTYFQFLNRQEAEMVFLYRFPIRTARTICLWTAAR